MTYKFGDWRLDPDARTLANATGAAHLTRKAFDLVLLLIEQRPNAVSKDQIYARLWPETFVTEASIQTLIREIRQTIDDPTSSQSWIRTVHGIGYSFAGAVSIVDATPSAAWARPAGWLVGASTRVVLYEGQNILGRGLDDVIEVDLPTVSRRHARITIGDVLSLEDLESKNGTWLNGERVTTARPLKDGDAVGLGSASFTFRLAGTARSTESSEMVVPKS